MNAISYKYRVVMMVAGFLGTTFVNESGAQEQKKVPTSHAYRDAVLASKPAAYWRLDERTGHVAEDSAGHKHNGKYEGKPHLGLPGALPHDKDTAVGFDGPKSKSYVEVPANKAFSVATSHHGLTVECWMRPDALVFKPENKDPKTPYIHWLGKGEAGHFEWGFRFYSDKGERPNRISAYIWNPDGKLGAGAYFEGKLKKGEWIHIVATYDDPKTPDARVRIYKNGVASKHNTSPGTLYKSYDIHPHSGHAPLRLGTRDLHGFLTGALDEVAIYPRVLSPEEIRHHWEAARAIR